MHILLLWNLQGAYPIIHLEIKIHQEIQITLKFSHVLLVKSIQV